MNDEYKAWIWHIWQIARRSGGKIRRIKYYLEPIAPEETRAFNNLLGDIDIDL